MKTKHIWSAMALSFTILAPSALHAKMPNYWQGKGRIALSSDGNMHDNDDMQATMMTLMILAKANLQSHTTLYTYADHVWGNERNDLDIMTVSAEEAGRRFGFDQTQFIAAVENPELAYVAMSEQILQSTAEDPLFIIAAGPMHVVGTALARADSINRESLNYVTVLSHSNWNNRHSDKANINIGEHSEPEGPHHGWCWGEMVESFGNRTNFNYILDQNGTGKNPYISKDKFSAPSWEHWEWMLHHPDPQVQWVYTQGKANPAKPDYSDAGLAYYLCADLDGVRGDEFGNPKKLEAWTGKQVFQFARPVITHEKGITVGEDFIAIEAEATKSKLRNWVLRTPQDPLYSSLKSHPKPMNGAYLEYMGGNPFGRKLSEANKDVLVYTFVPKTDGDYIFTGRMAQRLTVDGKRDRSDLCNDIYIKLKGDFESANATPKEILTSWNKFYGRGLDRWGSFSQIDVNHKKYRAVYRLKAGEKYTLSVSGRSQRCNVDYFIFSKAPFVFGDHIDIAPANKIGYRPFVPFD